MKKYRTLASVILAVMASYCLAADAKDKPEPKPASPQSKAATNDVYSEPQIYGRRPSPDQEWNLGPIGATGIRSRIYKGLKVTVEDTVSGSPSDGKLAKGDVIIGVNGEKLWGRNPLVVLGKTLTEAEATDGVLVFMVLQEGATDAKEVKVTIPVLGSYSNTFPLHCTKSDQIIRRAADFYAGEDRLKEFNLWNALACLYLLSTGDDQYLPRVKAYFAQFVDGDGRVTGVADHSWFNGYNGVACAEYYLRTGDKSVMPLLAAFLR